MSSCATSPSGCGRVATTRRRGTPPVRPGSVPRLVGDQHAGAPASTRRRSRCSTASPVCESSAPVGRRRGPAGAPRPGRGRWATALLLAAGELVGKRSPARAGHLGQRLKGVARARRTPVPSSSSGSATFSTAERGWRSGSGSGRYSRSAAPHLRQATAVQPTEQGPVHVHLPGARAVQSAGQCEQGRFARARWAHDGHQFPAPTVRLTPRSACTAAGPAPWVRCTSARRGPGRRLWSPPCLLVGPFHRPPDRDAPVAGGGAAPGCSRSGRASGPPLRPETIASRTSRQAGPRGGRWRTSPGQLLQRPDGGAALRLHP